MIVLLVVYMFICVYMWHFKEYMILHFIILNITECFILRLVLVMHLVESLLLLSQVFIQLIMLSGVQIERTLELCNLVPPQFMFYIQQ